MGIFQTAEEWAWKVALRKIIAATIGFLASQQAVAGIAWLETHGIHLSIDTQKFQIEMTALGIAGFAALHDWLKLKFPDSKYL